MKMLLYSDLHLGTNRMADEAFVNTICWINKVADEEHCTEILNLGDTLDCKGGRTKVISPKDSSLLNSVDLSKHIILRGNHERSQEGDLILSLKCKHSVIDAEVMFDNCLLLPYGARLSPDFPNRYKCIFAHCDYKGAKFDNGHIDEHDTKALNGLQYDMLFLGHYHVRQTPAKNVLCIGAVQSRIFSPSNEKVGVTVLDTDNLQCDFIENPYGKINIKPQTWSEESEDEREWDYKEFKENRLHIKDSLTKMANSDDLLAKFCHYKGLNSRIIKCILSGEVE
jgi:DNA repair exonuclease SbcCD nuclease subunit